jgi:hypothetical protein
MGTLIVHRLIIDRDRSVVESASGEIDKSAAAFLPTLGPGEAIIIGVDIPVPLSIRIQRPDRAPDSTGPNHEIYWANKLKLKMDEPRQVSGLSLAVLEFDEGEFITPTGTKVGPRSHVRWGSHEYAVGEESCLPFDTGAWRCVEVCESTGSITLIRVG